MAEDLIFSALTLKGWRQFESVSIELHPHLTILTGANGAGKSTILRIFSRHLGFDRPYLGTPVARKESGGALRYLTGIFSAIWNNLNRTADGPPLVGQLTYSNGVVSDINVPTEPGVQYGLSFSQELTVRGTHIDSHQGVSVYKQIEQIPLTAVTAEAAFQNYNTELANRFQGHAGQPVTYRLKEALISMALLGAGNTYVPGQPAILRTYTGFIEVLRSILPETLGFLDLAIRPPEVVMVTKTGEFLLDAASGGVATLIDIAWRLHTFSQQQDKFVVTMDEPENHLHPSMQRSLMGRLIATFPEVQFIVATHSPFIVSSVRDANVYVLRYRSDDNRVIEGVVPEAAKSRISSEKLSWVSKAGSANDILREVLGVPATMPEWAENALDQIVTQFRGRAITADSLADLRSVLAENGFDDYYADALSALVKASSVVPRGLPQ